MTARHEPLAVTLARIEERLIALDGKVDDHAETSKDIHKLHRERLNSHSGDLDSLKQSRASVRGVLGVLLVASGALGLDKVLMWIK
jgi:hypothetical protein